MQSNLERLSAGIDQPGLRPLRPSILESVSARVVGTGNCQEFCRTALLDMGGRLKRGERAIAVVSSDRSHAFVEATSRRRDGSARTVVVDPWANGPPVLKEDCAYARQSVPSGAVVDEASVGRRAVRAADRLVAAFESDRASVRALEDFLEARAAFSRRHPGAAATVVYAELETMPDPPDA